MDRAQEEAVAWYARLQAPDCRPEERAQFEHWLDHAEHAQAYAAVERLLLNLDLRARQDGRLLAMTKQAMAMGGADGIITPVTPIRLSVNNHRRQLLAYAAAASVVLSLFLGLALPGLMTEQDQILVFDAPAEAQRAVTLVDGTLANLDINSAVTVHMTAKARVINLVQGRALFDVAHDAKRPFSVAAGSSRIIALGTRFQVQHQERLIIVTLEEGSVDVETRFEGHTLREHLRPGEQLRFNQASGQWSKTVVETEGVTSWARGRHVFRNARLGEALIEVNRYAGTNVRLGDPALADLTVSGNFIIGDSSAIVSAFEAALPVRVVDGGNELILFAAYERDDQLEQNREQ